MNNLELAAKLREIRDRIDGEFTEAIRQTDKTFCLAHLVGRAMGDFINMSIEAEYLDRTVLRPEPVAAKVTA